MISIQMSLTSLWYILLLVVGVAIYYVVPKKSQWGILLILSLLFYCFSTNPKTLIFPLFFSFVSYVATFLFEKGISDKAKKIVLCSSLVVIGMTWLLTSGSGLLFFFVPSVPLAMGMGYFTCQIIAYIVDCYWGITQRQKNPFKLFAFVIFFPQLTTGPISRYENLKTIYEGHKFKYKNICFGAQRILWGFFKKLVIADRASLIVNDIWSRLGEYGGAWHIGALLLYPIVLYADFSGCLDIVIGTAELFDIGLVENFNNPFFSKSIREFWSRWHITLGKWAKDYIMYPVLKAPIMVNLSKSAKKKYGKHIGKFLVSALASFFVWLVMGVWHGGLQHIVGVSLYYWILIELGEYFDPIWDKVFERLKINRERYSFNLFRKIRTYLLFCVGSVFFKASTAVEALSFIRLCVEDIFKWNMKLWTLFDGSILESGITFEGINLIIVGVFLMVIIGMLRERYGYARNFIAEQGLVFRWIIWIILLCLVVIYGAYGPGFDATTFIYQGF